mgnify:FL=1
MIDKAYSAWEEAADFRARRARQKRYTYGDQWSDIVPDGTGAMKREYDLAMEKGKRPLTNNLLRQLVKAIVGRYRTRASEQGLYDSEPGSVDARNALAELDARMLEEFVVSGAAVQRVVAERRPGGDGVWVDNVDLRMFFVNPYRDPRGLDIDFVGMLHDFSWPEVVNRFSRGSRTRTAWLKTLLDQPVAGPFADGPALGSPSGGDVDFFRAPDGRFRVVETWALEGRTVNVRGRVRMEMVWRCRWLAPDGTVLDEYNSPFPHGTHPFVVKLYPLTDGEVHSFVEDVIDQQRNINRLVTLIDSMMGASAKGVLLFPIDQLPRGVSLQDVTSCWAHTDAVIPITGRGNQLPTQLQAVPNPGAYQLLDLQMNLFERTCGISDALLGRNVSPATGSTLYEAQVQNATIALADLLDTFASFTAARSAKVARTLAAS